MLHLLARLRQEIPFALFATHVCHGLVPGADVWGRACGDICAQLEVPLACIDVSVSRDHPGGLEAAARQARREALLRSGEPVLALAHHRDDQAETVLFRSIRGAGVRGVAAMRGANVTSSGQVLWRPLLEVPRSALLVYAQEHGLSWIEDPSNADQGFSRNFLRHGVMPLLEARFPGATIGLSRLGRLCGEASDLLDELARTDLAAMAPCGLPYLDRNVALGLSSARLRNVMRCALESEGVAMPDEDRLREIERQFRTDGAPRGLRLPVGEVAFCIFRESWWVEPLPLDTPPAFSPCSGSEPVSWGRGLVSFEAVTGDGLAADLLRARECCLKVRAGGERMRLRQGSPMRTLKNLLQEAAVPPWRRPFLPMLWVDGQLAWVAGVGVAAEFQCAPGQPGLRPVWSLHR